MKVKLNGSAHDVPDGITLAVFVENLGLKPQGIAVAVDYEVVPKEQWSELVLTDDIELMLIHAVSGG